jgi:hypothetical protein
MKKLLSTLCVLAMIGCGSSPSNSDGPQACDAHFVRQYNLGEMVCVPGKSETCAFGVHNQLVKLDQSGEPLAYYCTCEATGTYACWGAPSLAKADPLPPE